MINFYYYSFKEYQKLDKSVKDQFTFLSTSYSTPVYWSGMEFAEFVPSKQLFQDACLEYKTSHFEERYKAQIYGLNSSEIIKKLNELSPDKDVVFLVWEDETKGSERDIFIPWLTNSSICDLKNFSFSRKLEVLNNKCQNLFAI